MAEGRLTKVLTETAVMAHADAIEKSNLLPETAEMLRTLWAMLTRALADRDFLQERQDAVVRAIGRDEYAQIVGAP